MAIWSIPIFTLIGIALFLANYGMKSKSVGVIRPSHFEQAGDMGFWTYRQLRQRLFRMNLLLLGYDPKSSQHDQVLKAFVRTARSDGQNYSTIFSAKSLEFSDARVVNLAEPIDLAALESQLQEVFNRGERAILYLPTQTVSRLFAGTMSEKLTKETELKFISISMLERNSEQLESLRKTQMCEGDFTYDSMEALGCSYLLKQSKFDKELKDQKPTALAGALELFGQDDYVMFLYKTL